MHRYVRQNINMIVTAYKWCVGMYSFGVKLHKAFNALASMTEKGEQTPALSDVFQQSARENMNVRPVSGPIIRPF